MISQWEPEHVFYRQGLVAYQSGDWVQSEKYYQDALRLKPDWAMARYNLGVVLAQQARLAEAARQYEKSIALDSTYGPALENLGCVYLSQGFPAQAIERFQRAIALNAQQPSLWNNLGQAFYANRDRACLSGPSTSNVQRAIDAYMKALQLQPDLLIAQLNLGVLFHDQAQDNKAIACFQAVLEQNSEHLFAHHHCAQLYFRQGYIDKAIYHWQHLATLQSHLFRPYCYQVLQEGEGAGTTDDLLKVVRWSCAQFLYCLLQKAPVAETCQWLQQTYDHLGCLLMQEEGGKTQAEHYFRQALCISPNQATVLLNLADCLAQQHRFDAATMLYSLGQTEGDRSPSTGFKSNPLNPQTVIWGYASTAAWVNTTAIASVHYTPIAYHASNSSPVPGLTGPRVKPAAVDFPPKNLPCGVTCTACMADLRQAFQPHQIAENIYRCGPFDAECSVEADDFDPFVVTIPHGRAWVAPHRNSWEICHSIAVITPDQTLLADVSRDYPWRLPGCRYGYRHQHRLLTSHGSLPTAETLEGRVALLSGLSGHIYYHWMMDVLPRFGLLATAGWDWDDIDWFVVNSVQRPFQRESLERVGLPNHKIVESDRHPHIQADELIVPSFPGPLDWPPKHTIDFLRSTFLQGVNARSPLDIPPNVDVLDAYPPYVYISRAQGKLSSRIERKPSGRGVKPIRVCCHNVRNLIG